MPAVNERDAITKTCTGCGSAFTLENFSAQKGGKYGVTSKCKPCCRKVGSERQKNNRGKAAARLQRWRKNNAEHVRDRDRKYYQATKEKRVESVQRWQKKNPGSKLLAGATYRANHADALKEWRRANRPTVAAHATARENRQRDATPQWLTPAQRKTMKTIYQMSVRLSQCTGIKHHVDHVMPLNAATSCGLHVPWNLRAIPALINLRKKNTIERSCY